MRTAVGEVADDLRGEGVSEAVNDEEVAGDGGGADRAGNRVDDGGVERAGVEEEEELGGKERGNGPGRGTEEDQRAARQGERDTPAPLIGANYCKRACGRKTSLIAAYAPLVIKIIFHSDVTALKPAV